MPHRFRSSFADTDTSSDASSGDGDAQQGAAGPSGRKKRSWREQEPSLEELQRAGFTSGPSVLGIKEQPEDESYDWGRGSPHAEDVEEDLEVRDRDRAAATYGTEQAARRAIETARQAARANEQDRLEHAETQQRRRESYQQREKRKRDLGQAKKGKNYVEEEKRHLRQHHIYSGFDN